MRALTRNLDFVSTVSLAVTERGWDNYATDHEDANGQFEQNFSFADALTTCDRAVFFRYMVESMAIERGLIATFMPKPFAHPTGNGPHFHVSMRRDGVNLRARPGRGSPRLRVLRARLSARPGLDGIERCLDPGEPNAANLHELSPEQRAAAGIETVPANLLDATRELERCEVLRHA
ncbi:MAG: hypothetical protein M3071_25555, partial [Actinomycetota bacterium]|nr:hypothetical protein [Actinomycetota bacterium]